MKTRKLNQSLVFVTIIVVLGLALSACAQKGSTTTTKATVLTDPNLIKAQETQNELLATQRMLEASLERETALRSKVEDAQATFRKQSARAELRHAEERREWQSTATFYENKWQEARRPVAFYATWWMGLVYGVLLVLGLQGIHRWVKKVHGSYQKWLRHVWSNRPRITCKGGPAHG